MQTKPTANIKLKSYSTELLDTNMKYITQFNMRHYSQNKPNTGFSLFNWTEKDCPAYIEIHNENYLI